MNKYTYSWYRIKRFWRYWWQRRTRGWDDTETWNLDHTIAKFIVPRLRKLKELNNGYPPTLTPQEWDEILDSMIWTFSQVIEDGIYWSYSEDDWKKFQNGLDNFSKYYRDLWW